MSTTATTGRPGLRQGSVFGAIAGAIYLIVFALAGLVHVLGASTLINLVAFFAIIVVAIFAGVRAASQTGKVSSGLVAGTFVGLLMSVLGTIGALIFDYLNIDALVSAANEAIKQAEKQSGTSTGVTYTNTSFLLAAAGLSIVAILFQVLIGLAAGAIGGAFGRGRAPKPAPAVYQDSLYSGGLTPTAPIYPPQGPQPASPPPAQESPTQTPLQ